MSWRVKTVLSVEYNPEKEVVSLEKSWWCGIRFPLVVCECWGIRRFPAVWCIFVSCEAVYHQIICPLESQSPPGKISGRAVVSYIFALGELGLLDPWIGLVVAVHVCLLQGTLSLVGVVECRSA